ncbi:hypothetical protein KGZ01_04290 [Pseudomonas aeruginosa]|uniref:hypothetical protein n=1 Tax=Pseudomonas aeruginosa TaxID=287 RepID=UPI0008FB2939|nr:hypothetical protein [Pseudomonas aeruginosa]MBG4277075.1 hypothetical protein [Pseudomonas aeruginosa]MDC3990445.1 hypothetical protein [Pseudomonas aeruginosa]OPD98956.1 hypothetical protein AO994_29765 [Pseudomonas aeruginosa]QYE76699.1 hypothetical protein KZ795_26060 [Pseudomonas aeruginosa]
MSFVKIGKYYRVLKPNGVVQLVSPEENSDGIIIQTAAINPASGWVNLYASEKPPISPGDPETRIVFNGNGNVAAGSNTQVELPSPLYIPAGMGIWVSSGSWSGSTPVLGSLVITWDRLA